MVKECPRCKKYFNSNGEIICLNCKVSDYDLISTKRDRAKSIKAWNKMAAESHARIEAKYGVKPYKQVERYVDANLGVKYEIK